MDGLVDIYMPDFKYWSRERSKTYMQAENYPEAARAAIKAMHDQVGPLVFDDDGLAQRGVLVRHLVMPGGLDETRESLQWIATELGADTYVNLMDQYFPAGKSDERPLFGNQPPVDVGRVSRSRDDRARCRPAPSRRQTSRSSPARAPHAELSLRLEREVFVRTEILDDSRVAGRKTPSTHARVRDEQPVEDIAGPSNVQRGFEPIDRRWVVLSPPVICNDLARRGPASQPQAA